MWSIVAAFIGGIFLGGIVFIGIGAVWGYAKAIRHMTALGTLILQNAAAPQKPQTPVAVSSNSSTRFN